MDNKIDIAVLIPCYNEEQTIPAVVKDFKASLPTARIYVYDNNSQDRTVEVAEEAGAIVRSETKQGKGNVVRRMFSDIDADVYVLVDGDDTYDAASAPMLVARLLSGPYDMVNASRKAGSDEAYRPGHKFGNRMLTDLVSFFFGRTFRDILSGYRVFSRRFVKSFPALSQGFEIETELTVHALELMMPVVEVPTPFKDRPEGSESKLRTFSDGFRILKTIGLLVKEEKPMRFFSVIAAIFALVSIILAIPIVITFMETSTVPRFPTAILSTGLMLVAFLSFFSGLILGTVTLGRREYKRLMYLQYSVYSGSSDK